MSECVSGNVHLLDGTDITNGRVEVCVDAQWVTVCGKGWTDEDAEVVCNQLGLPTIGKHRKASCHCVILAGDEVNKYDAKLP